MKNILPCATLFTIENLFCQPIFLVGYEEAVDGDGEGEDAEPDHEGGVDVEPHRPEVQLQHTVMMSKNGP